MNKVYKQNLLCNNINYEENVKIDSITYNVSFLEDINLQEHLKTFATLMNSINSNIWLKIKLNYNISIGELIFDIVPKTLIRVDFFIALLLKISATELNCKSLSKY